MHPKDCPEWEYSDHQDREGILDTEAKGILADLRRGQIDTAEAAADTRPIHRRLFLRLTPSGYWYYAGHYRGENFKCLRYYAVCIPNDPRVGVVPEKVVQHMEHLACLIRDALKMLDVGHGVSNARLAPEDKLLYTVVVAAKIFELFLRFHPYANGNGHAGRFCVLAILGRYGYWARKWSLEPRPSDPPYTDAIVAYRNGNSEPLETFLLDCLSARSG